MHERQFIFSPHLPSPSHLRFVDVTQSSGQEVCSLHSVSKAMLLQYHSWSHFLWSVIRLRCLSSLLQSCTFECTFVCVMYGLVCEAAWFCSCSAFTCANLYLVVWHCTENNLSICSMIHIKDHISQSQLHIILIKLIEGKIYHKQFSSNK